MTPLEMIAEWRKGCTIAGPMHTQCYPDGEPMKTGYCVECTEALIDALEKAIREEQTAPVAVLRFASGVPGNENEMPRVLSCNWQPDGEYRVFLSRPYPAEKREPFTDGFDEGWRARDQGWIDSGAASEAAWVEYAGRRP